MTPPMQQPRKKINQNEADENLHVVNCASGMKRELNKLKETNRIFFKKIMFLSDLQNSQRLKPDMSCHLHEDNGENNRGREGEQKIKPGEEKGRQND